VHVRKANLRLQQTGRANSYRHTQLVELWSRMAMQNTEMDKRSDEDAKQDNSANVVNIHEME